MNNTPDALANDTGGTGFRHEIAVLSTGIAEARREITAAQVYGFALHLGRGIGGKPVDLSRANTQRAAPDFVRQDESCIGDFHAAMVRVAVGQYKRLRQNTTQRPALAIFRRVKWALFHGHIVGRRNAHRPENRRV